MSDSVNVHPPFRHLGLRLSRRDFLRVAGLATVALPSTRMLSSNVSTRGFSADAGVLPGLPIWCDDHGQGRNVYAHFRLSFGLKTAPAHAELHLFADTRYRLRVNGAIVGLGPSAFLVAYPEFDSIDLAPWLRQGENEITVEVNARGDSSFQAEPSRGGFIAWGEAREADGENLADFGTPGNWQVRRPNAWASGSPPFSFAQGPVEIVDLSLLPAGGEIVDAHTPGWQTPVAAPKAHWGTLAPRSVPLPEFDFWRPSRLLTLAPLESRLARVSAFRGVVPPATLGPDLRFACVLWLHTPQPVATTLSVSPGDYWLNGKPAVASAQPNQVAAEQLNVELRAGWNLLYGELRPSGRLIGLIVGWPRETELRASAFPGDDGTSRIRLTEAMSLSALHQRRGAVPAHAADLERFGEALDSGIAHTPFPSREVAWDRPASATIENPERIDGFEIPRSPAGEGIAVYDFGREFIGHIALEIDAPSGGIVDVTNEELQRADGAVRMFQRNIGVNPVDRLLLREGLNLWEGFHARGGRLVQLTVRSTGPVTLRRIALRNALVRVPASGTFSCNDPLFDWTWDLGVATLEASLTDGWIDPWREQGLYIGDVLVEYLAHRAWTRDNSHIIRALRMWARAQLADGQLQPVVPSWLYRSHADYTLLWIVILRDYVRHSGDHALARELWPCVERIWQSPMWRANSDGLWTAEDTNVFGDWGATELAIKGDANGILNAFRVGALDASAELADAIGQEKAAADLRRERETVAASYRRVLWNHKTNAFAPCLSNGAPVHTSAAHANVLALLYRIATPDQEAGALALVRASIAAAAAAPDRCERRGGHIELYFLHYVLELLGERGLHADAEEIIRTFWGLQRDHGAWCLWEAFYRGLRREDSQCHGWSAGPSVYFHRFVLGIEASPEHVTIAPSSATLTDAQGVHPHPRGDITIAWHVENDAFYLDVELPAGLGHDVRPGAAFAHLQPHVNVRTRS